MNIRMGFQYSIELEEEGEEEVKPFLGLSCRANDQTIQEQEHLMPHSTLMLLISTNKPCRLLTRKF
jgi:hypothetical protein